MANILDMGRVQNALTGIDVNIVASDDITLTAGDDITSTSADNTLIQTTDGSITLDANGASLGDIVIDAADLVDINAGGIFDLDAAGEVQITSASAARVTGSSVNLSNTSAANSLILGTTNVTMGSGGTLNTTSVGSTTITGASVTMTSAAGNSVVLGSGNVTLNSTAAISSTSGTTTTIGTTNGALTLNANAGSAGTITLNAAGASGVNLNSTHATTGQINATTTSGAITLNAQGATLGNLIIDTAGSTGVDIDVGGSGAFSVNLAGAANLTLDALAAGGAVFLRGNAGASVSTVTGNVSIYGGGVLIDSASEVYIRPATNIQATTTDGAINLTAAGAVNGNLNIDSAGSTGIDIDVAGTGAFAVNTTDGAINLTAAGATNGNVVIGSAGTTGVDINVAGAGTFNVSTVGGEIVLSSVGDTNITASTGGVKLDASTYITFDTASDFAQPSRALRIRNNSNTNVSRWYPTGDMLPENRKYIYDPMVNTFNPQWWALTGTGTPVSAATARPGGGVTITTTDSANDTAILSCPVVWVPRNSNPVFRCFIDIPVITNIVVRVGIHESLGVATTYFDFTPATSAFWRTVSTEAGTTTNTTDVTVAANTRYELMITELSTAAGCAFYINMALAFTHTGANIPTATTLRKPFFYVETTADAATNLEICDAYCGALIGAT
jgi:hypothetical protein